MSESEIAVNDACGKLHSALQDVFTMLEAPMMGRVGESGAEQDSRVFEKERNHSCPRGDSASDDDIVSSKRQKVLQHEPRMTATNRRQRDHERRRAVRRICHAVLDLEESSTSLSEQRKVWEKGEGGKFQPTPLDPSCPNSLRRDLVEDLTDILTRLPKVLFVFEGSDGGRIHGEGENHLNDRSIVGDWYRRTVPAARRLFLLILANLDCTHEGLSEALSPSASLSATIASTCDSLLDQVATLCVSEIRRDTSPSTRSARTNNEAPDMPFFLLANTIKLVNAIFQRFEEQGSSCCSLTFQETHHLVHLLLMRSLRDFDSTLTSAKAHLSVTKQRNPNEQRFICDSDQDASQNGVENQDDEIIAECSFELQLLIGFLLQHLVSTLTGPAERRAVVSADGRSLGLSQGSSKFFDTLLEYAVEMLEHAHDATERCCSSLESWSKHQCSTPSTDSSLLLLEHSGRSLFRHRANILVPEALRYASLAVGTLEKIFEVCGVNGNSVSATTATANTKTVLPSSCHSLEKPLRSLLEAWTDFVVLMVIFFKSTPELEHSEAFPAERSPENQSILSNVGTDLAASPKTQGTADTLLKRLSSVSMRFQKVQQTACTTTEMAFNDDNDQGVEVVDHARAIAILRALDDRESDESVVLDDPIVAPTELATPMSSMSSSTMSIGGKPSKPKTPQVGRLTWSAAMTGIMTSHLIPRLCATAPIEQCSNLNESEKNNTDLDNEHQPAARREIEALSQLLHLPKTNCTAPIGGYNGDSDSCQHGLFQPPCLSAWNALLSRKLEEAQVDSMSSSSSHWK